MLPVIACFGAFTTTHARKFRGVGLPFRASPNREAIAARAHPRVAAQQCALRQAGRRDVPLAVRTARPFRAIAKLCRYSFRAECAPARARRSWALQFSPPTRPLKRLRAQPCKDRRLAARKTNAAPRA